MTAHPSEIVPNKTIILANSHGAVDVLDRHTKEVITSATTRDLAEWAQLREELGLDRATQLQRMASRHPQLTSRIKRAGLMFARRLCGPLDWDDPTRYRCRSQTQSNKEYQVYLPTRDLTVWTCTVIADPMAGTRRKHCCPDIAHNAPSIEGQGPRCKHMILCALHVAWVWKPWHAHEAELKRQRQAKTIARYADGTEVQPDDLPTFGAHIAQHRALPASRVALFYGHR